MWPCNSVLLVGGPVDRWPFWQVALLASGSIRRWPSWQVALLAGGGVLIFFVCESTPKKTPPVYTCGWLVHCCFLADVSVMDLWTVRVTTCASCSFVLTRSEKTPTDGLFCTLTTGQENSGLRHLDLTSPHNRCSMKVYSILIACVTDQRNLWTVCSAK
jgi:hypothetical protein